MLSLTLSLWILVALFGFIGFMRLWQREILVTAAIVLALFAWNFIDQGNRLINLFAKEAPAQATPAEKESANLVRTLAASAPLLLMIIVGYSGPLLSSGFRPGRFPNRDRSGLQEGFVGFMLGALNGFLTLSSLLLYARRMKLLTDSPLPISGGTPIITVPPGGWDKFFFIQAAPLEVLSTFSLTLVFVVVVLFLLIALL